MATSQINMECKRYGCMKNLLACYANCRYNTRCDDLRNELIDKTEQAASDINAYLAERGRKPVMIQILKRGLKFAEASKSDAAKTAKAFKSKPVESPAAAVKVAKARAASYLEKNRVSRNAKKAAELKTDTISQAGGELNEAQEKPARIRQNENIRKRRTMAKKTKRPKTVTTRVNERLTEIQSSAPESSAESKSAPGRAARRTVKSNSAKLDKSKRNGRIFIILEGRAATLVDEQGLMLHLINNASADARYFEAKEVEARVHIVPKA
ncbi:MAG TPA: hypothetical protein VNN73_17050 [Blastocatellia bacterium]|nr:hypothetical protein [Blastocatellia bacterium]